MFCFPSSMQGLQQLPLQTLSQEATGNKRRGMQETGELTKRRAKRIWWRMVEGGHREPSVETGLVIIMPSAARSHCSPDNRLHQSKGLNQGEKAIRFRTHRPPLPQKKGTGNFKDGSKRESQDDNRMANLERRSSPGWRKIKVSRRDNSRKKKKLKMMDYLLWVTLRKAYHGCKRKLSKWKQQSNY